MKMPGFVPGAEDFSQKYFDGEDSLDDSSYGGGIGGGILSRD